MSRKIGALVEYALPCQSGDQIDELSEKMRKTISVHCPFILLYWRPQASNNYRNIFDSLVLQIPRSFLHISETLKWIFFVFLLVSNLFSLRVQGLLSVLGFYFMYNIGRMPGFEPELLQPQPGVLPISYTHGLAKGLPHLYNSRFVSTSSISSSPIYRFKEMWICII